jgi:peptide/nickel transport system permease protein
LAAYVGKRLVQLVVIVWIISILAFLLVHLLPGDPTLTILGPNDTPAAREALLKQLGLNTSLFHQYITWLGNVLRGNLGQSFITHQTVTNAIATAIPIDLELIILSQLMAIIVAVPLALFSALRPNGALDRTSSSVSFGMLSIPTFVAAVLLVLVFAVELKWVPATGWTPLSQGLGPNLRSAILPAVALALGSVVIYFRLLRTDLIATLQEDFITMARSKGLSIRYIMLRHALRPSSFSLLAGAGISIGSLLTGAFVVEYLMSLDGLGLQIVNAINQRDYLMVQGLALFIAVAYVVVNFVVDFILTLLDPRIRRA